MQTLVVPVLVILQTRVDHQQRNHQHGYSGIDAQTLEEVRKDWCDLLGDGETGPEAAAVVTEIIPFILDSNSNNAPVMQTCKNRESVNLVTDLNLANRYVEVVKQYHKAGAFPKPHPSPQQQPVQQPSSQATNAPQTTAAAATAAATANSAPLPPVHDLEP